MAGNWSQKARPERAVRTDPVSGTVCARRPNRDVGLALTREESAMHKFKKILVPLDGSEFAEVALEPALAIAESMGAEMVLFRVAQPIPRTQKLAEMPDVYNDVVAATYREAQEYLEALQTRLPYEQIEIEYRPASGGVARQILDYAAEHGVDLIVLSSHGRTGLDRWIHGNVAYKLLTGCTCSTLVVRGLPHG
jgi:nucleotide-binding universal stress UspA family protein